MRIPAFRSRVFSKRMFQYILEGHDWDEKAGTNIWLDFIGILFLVMQCSGREFCVIFRNVCSRFSYVVQLLRCWYFWTGNKISKSNFKLQSFLFASVLLMDQLQCVNQCGLRDSCLDTEIALRMFHTMPVSGASFESGFSNLKSLKWNQVTKFRNTLHWVWTDKKKFFW